MRSPRSAMKSDSNLQLLGLNRLSSATKKARRPRLDTEASNEERDHAFRRTILSIPPGRVSTYGKVAADAGYPRYHRAVARLLRIQSVDELPWHRVLGAGGVIKLAGSAAKEQKARLKLEGVLFQGSRVDMSRFSHNAGTGAAPG